MHEHYHHASAEHALLQSGQRVEPDNGRDNPAVNSENKARLPLSSVRVVLHSSNTEASEELSLSASK